MLIHNALCNKILNDLFRYVIEPAGLSLYSSTELANLNNLCL